MSRSETKPPDQHGSTRNELNRKISTTTNPLFYDNVCHHRKESVFSKFSSSVNINGFKNVIIIMLLISTGRLVLENIVSYGFKANPIQWLEYVIEDPLSRPTFTLFLILNVFIGLSFMIERLYVFYLLCDHRVSEQATDDQKHKHLKFEVTAKEERWFRVLYVVILLVMLTIPVVVNVRYDCNPYLSSFVCSIYCITFLKLYSYHQVNSWWRTGTIYQNRLQPSDKLEVKLRQYQSEALKEQRSLVTYPQNLTLTNIYYFAYVPTLCYQLNFPRKKSRNYWFILRCLLEFVLLIELECVLMQQWVMTPLAMQRFLFSEMTVSQFLLRWSKMSLATISIWLVGFYSFFQSFLNLSAELFCFADRDFYQDWWNSRSVADFWRLWNTPVHRWVVRHIYKPMLYKDFSKLQATFAVFFVSGLFHEYIVSVPLRGIYVYFLLGMVGQVGIEIAVFSLGIKSWRFANALVWSLLIFGQSLMIVLYYNDVMRSA